VYLVAVGPGALFGPINACTRTRGYFSIQRQPSLALGSRHGPASKTGAGSFESRFHDHRKWPPATDTRLYPYFPASQPWNCAGLQPEHAKKSGGRTDKYISAFAHPGSTFRNGVFIVAFDTEVRTVTGFTKKQEDLKPVVLQSTPRRAGTSLYDSIVTALCQFKKARYGRQALIVLTDGADQHSHRTLSELVEQVQWSAAQVYMIGLFSDVDDYNFRSDGRTLTLVSGQEIDNPRTVFARLAEESGADVFSPSTAGELEAVATTIRNELRDQYYLGYYSEASASAPRRISMRG